MDSYQLFFSLMYFILLQHKIHFVSNYYFFYRPPHSLFLCVFLNSVFSSTCSLIFIFFTFISLLAWFLHFLYHLLLHPFSLYFFLNSPLILYLPLYFYLYFLSWSFNIVFSPSYSLFSMFFLSFISLLFF